MKVIDAKDFLRRDVGDKNHLISLAMSGEINHHFTKECLIEMLIYQDQQIDDLYDAFQIEQAGKSGYFD